MLGMVARTMLVGSLGVCLAAGAAFFWRRGPGHRIWIVVLFFAALLALAIPYALDRTGSVYVVIALAAVAGVGVLVAGFVLVLHLSKAHEERERQEGTSRGRLVRFPAMSTARLQELMAAQAGAATPADLWQEEPQGIFIHGEGSSMADEDHDVGLLVPATREEEDGAEQIMEEAVVVLIGPKEETGPDVEAKTNEETEAEAVIAQEVDEGPESAEVPEEAAISEKGEIPETVVIPEEEETPETPMETEKEEVPEAVAVSEVVEESESAMVSVTVPDDAVSQETAIQQDNALLGIALVLSLQERWSEAADAYLAYRAAVSDPSQLKVADMDCLTALMEAGRDREAVDLMFEILQGGYALSRDEREQITQTMELLLAGE